MLNSLAACFLVCGVVGQDEDRARLEAYLGQHNEAAVVQWFRDHSDEALPFVDHYLEGGLKMLEEKQDPAVARASFDTGVRFASFADRAFAENIFGRYATSFSGWDQAQQKKFRKGQEKFRAGRQSAKEGHIELALKQHSASLALAEPLGDAWGMAMAYRGIGDARLAGGDHRGARQAYSEAFWLNARLRLRQSQIKCLLGIAKANSGLGAPHAAMISLDQAQQFLRPKDDDLKQEILKARREVEQIMQKKQATSTQKP